MSDQDIGSPAVSQSYIYHTFYVGPGSVGRGASVCIARGRYTIPVFWASLPMNTSCDWLQQSWARSWPQQHSAHGGVGLGPTRVLHCLLLESCLFRDRHIWVVLTVMYMMTQELGRGPSTGSLPKAEQNLIISDHRGVTMDTSRFTLGWDGKGELLKYQLFLPGFPLFLTEPYFSNVLGTLLFWNCDNTL